MTLTLQLQLNSGKHLVVSDLPCRTRRIRKRACCTARPLLNAMKGFMTRKNPSKELVRFSELPTFRLHLLESITSKHGELVFLRLFGLRIVECRVLGGVQANEPVSLRHTCIEIGLDKSQGSRLVAKMVESGLLERRDDPDDQRSFFLLLTPEGRSLHRRINEAAVARNTAWRAGLPDDLCQVFLDCIERQIRHARQLLEQESALAKGTLPPAPSHEKGSDEVPKVRLGSPLLIKREQLEAVYHQLRNMLEQDVRIPQTTTKLADR